MRIIVIVLYTILYSVIPCSRWSEMTEALKFHVGLARAANAPCEFRLLNSAAPVSIGFGRNDEDAGYSTLIRAFEDSPDGGTPLCRHIREIVAKISSMETQLRSQGQKACVVIMTDGESSDGDIAQAMQPLKALPVWVVIRLCTDDDKIVNYWNNIDSQLELGMDVLDDLCGEAIEVGGCNPWLTYGEPLHRLREFGIAVKELDLLDESLLTLEQVRKMSSIM